MIGGGPRGDNLAFVKERRYRLNADNIRIDYELGFVEPAHSFSKCERNYGVY